MKNINITVENVSVEAEMYDTPTARKIFDAIPLEGSSNVWGDEIYFSIPLNIEQEPEASEDVKMGDLGYWPVGAAFCIFFGPTPVSTGNQPRAYSPVNVFGRVLGDPRVLKTVTSGAKIKISRAG
ncbi:MAG: hypothetical protein HKO68_06310 [Desulfobacterales bacterium]|nr:hypothetical protein [Deltaproteobacteria bacterium]NNL75929.1 hypothetical protein [Desulfobacterales bacterium]